MTATRLLSAPQVRLATPADEARAWQIVHEAALDMVRKGRHQWDAHYPARQTIHDDICARRGYVIESDGQVVAYAVISFDGEPSYDHLQGTWLTTGPYATIHRTAVALSHRGLRLSPLFFRKAALLCQAHRAVSIRIDTNYDNAEMLHLVEKIGFTRCGICHYERDGHPTPRIAFEKPTAETAAQE